MVSNALHRGGIAGWVSRWAQIQPERPAVIFGSETVTWADFDKRINRVAHVLADHGVKSGDRVGLYMRNRLEFLDTFLAIARLGAVVVPLNHFLTPRELCWTVTDSDVTTVCTHAEFADVITRAAEDIDVSGWLSYGEFAAIRSGDVAALAADAPSDPIEVDVAFDHPVAILYTSGTTGSPKGAVTTHGGVHFSTLNWMIHLGFSPQDRHLNHLPLSFTGGSMGGTLPVIHSGGTMVLESAFDAGRVLQLIEEQRIGYTIGVPTMWKAMLDHPRYASADLSSLKAGIIGGAPVPLPILEAYEARGVPLVQAYALTEGNALCLLLPADQAKAKLGSCGRPTLYCDADVVDGDGAPCPTGEVGEIVLRGPVVFAGYWRNPDATAEVAGDGWLHTGDLARRDEEGYLTIVDRKKELIISGGVNVYPAEVESVLYALPDVAEAAVVGLPDEKWGEEVTAVVVPKPEAELTQDTVLAHCRENLAGYKVPKRVLFTDSLPKTMSGKIQRRSVRARYVVGEQTPE